MNLGLGLGLGAGRPLSTSALLSPDLVLPTLLRFGTPAASVLLYAAWEWSRRKDPEPSLDSLVSGDRADLDRVIHYYRRRGQRVRVLEFLASHCWLGPPNIARGRWWTFITCAFTHTALGDLVPFVVSFNTCASMAFSLGMGASDFAVLMLGSAAASSVGAVRDLQRRKRRRGDHALLEQNPSLMGDRAAAAASSGHPAAGLAMATTTTANDRDNSNRSVLVEWPRNVMPIFGGSGLLLGITTTLACWQPMLVIRFWGLPCRLLVLVGGMIAYDVVNLPRTDSGSTLHGKTLAGAAFGVLFYVLRLRMVRPRLP